MNVAAHQNKEKSEKTGKRKAGEKRKQADFKEAACYLLRLFRGLHGKKIFCVRGVAGILGKANSHFNPTQMGLGSAPPC